MCLTKFGAPNVEINSSSKSKKRPPFGSGHDLHIRDGCKGEALQGSYGTKQSLSEPAYQVLSGSTSNPRGYFQCDDYEIFTPSQ